METRTEQLTLADGVRLHVYSWSPSDAPATRTLLLIHGGCEHSGRYPHVAERFVARGWRVIAPDQRGHGLSDGPRAHVDSFDTYLRDLREVQAHYCGGRAADVWLGHSAGGLTAVRLLQTSPPPRALVLVAPVFGLLLPVPTWKRWLGHALVRLCPRWRFRTGIDPQNLSRDPEVRARRRADPLHLRFVTVGWFFALQAAIEQAHAQADRVTCPLLTLQGLDDRTVDPAALNAWRTRVGSAVRDHIELPGHVHELLNEPDWSTTCDLILDWLDRQTPATGVDGGPAAAARRTSIS